MHSLGLARKLRAPRAPFSPAPRRSLTSSPPRLTSSSSSIQPPSQPSATAIFYRQLVPAMLHSIALGSIVYFALELTHNYIEREFVAEKLQAEVDRLEGELERLKSGKNGLEQSVGEKSWWKVW